MTMSKELKQRIIIAFGLIALQAVISFLPAIASGYR